MDLCVSAAHCVVDQKTLTIGKEYAIAKMATREWLAAREWENMARNSSNLEGVVQKKVPQFQFTYSSFRRIEVVFVEEKDVDVCVLQLPGGQQFEYGLEMCPQSELPKLGEPTADQTFMIWYLAISDFLAKTVHHEGLCRTRIPVAGVHSVDARHIVLRVQLPRGASGAPYLDAQNRVVGVHTNQQKNGKDHRAHVTSLGIMLSTVDVVMRRLGLQP